MPHPLRNKEEGNFSIILEELRYRVFEFLDEESWENVARVCNVWNTRICEILWKKRETHTATLSCIYCLTDLIQLKNARWERDKQLEQDYTFFTSFYSYFTEMDQRLSEKEVLETILNRLLTRKENPPKNLFSILTYNTQIEKEIAHSLLESIHNKDDLSRLRKELSQSSGPPTSKNISDLVSLLAVNKFNAHYLGINSLINKIIKRALHAGHVEEVMEYRNSLHLRAQSCIPITTVMERLMRMGLFHKTLSFVYHLSISQLGNTPSRSGLFYTVCIDKGFLATAATTLRQALTKRHNEETAKKIASNLVILYLNLGEIEEALPLISQFELHLSPDFCGAAAEKLTQHGNLEEAIPFIRMCKENDCKIYLSPNFSHTVVKRLAQAENFEEALTCVQIYDDLKLLPYQKIREELLDHICKAYIRKKDPETAESFILATFEGPHLVKNLLRLTKNHMRNDRREKALELLKQCSLIATKDRDVLKICSLLLKLEKSEIAITIIEQDKKLISHIMRKKHRLIHGAKKTDILSQFLQFIDAFSKLNRKLIQKNPTTSLQSLAEITQRLSNILDWIGREDYRLNLKISELQDRLTLSLEQ